MSIIVGITVLVDREGEDMKAVIKTIVAGIFSILLLSSFSFIYKYTPGRVITSESATDYKWESNGFMNTMEEGFSWLLMDKNGYNNVCTFEQNDILILGSSHMEGVQVSRTENMAYVLNKLLDDRTVYNLGISGHEIYNCVANLRYAITQFKPNEYIIIETDSVLLSEEKMQEVIDESLPEIASRTGVFSIICKYLPAVKLIALQFSNWIDVEENIYNDSQPLSAICIDEEYVGVLTRFLQKARADASDDCRIIIFYHPKSSIDKDGQIVMMNEDEAISIFEYCCKKEDIIFVDMTEDFLELFNQYHLLAHGFINSGVGRGHLNKNGHDVTAHRLAEVIMGEQTQ